MAGKIKAPSPAGRMWLFGMEIYGVWHTGPAGAFTRNTKIFNAPNAIHGVKLDPAVTTRDDDFSPRPGRI